VVVFLALLGCAVCRAESIFDILSQAYPDCDFTNGPPANCSPGAAMLWADLAQLVSGSGDTLPPLLPNTPPGTLPGDWLLIDIPPSDLLSLLGDPGIPPPTFFLSPTPDVPDPSLPLSGSGTLTTVADLQPMDSGTVPEPAAIALMAAGMGALAGVATWRWKRS